MQRIEFYDEQAWWWHFTGLALLRSPAEHCWRAAIPHTSVVPMTFLELAKKALPGATDQQADAALWNHTTFPFDTSPRKLFKALSGYRRACSNGLRLCDTCHNIAQPDRWLCARCEGHLQ